MTNVEDCVNSSVYTGNLASSYVFGEVLPKDKDQAYKLEVSSRCFLKSGVEVPGNLPQTQKIEKLYANA